MKEFIVYLYDLAAAPLDGRKSCHPAQIKSFDDKDDAVACARSERRKWDRVTVHKKGSTEVIVSFHGDNMYVGSQRTKLKDNE